MLVVGLTGGIASGKSTAAEILRGQGAAVVSSDVLAREAVAPGEPALEAIVSAFGASALAPDGTLDRRALGRRVFADPEALARLEAILHPEIRARTLRALRALQRTGQPAAVCEIPLLFEVGLHLPGSFIDQIWLVYVPEQEQVRRLVLREGLHPEEARRRLRAQWPMERKRPLADVVVDNTGPWEDLADQVLRAWEAVLVSAPRYPGLRGVPRNDTKEGRRSR